MFNWGLDRNEHIELNTAAHSFSRQLYDEIGGRLPDASPEESTGAIDLAYIFRLALFDELCNLFILLPQVNLELD